VSGPPLSDGVYDAFVVDARVHGDGRTTLELTIIAGEHKGEVLELTATGLEGDEIELMGMPATVTIDGGTPRVRIDR
jgi:hypothetical protein